MKAKGKSRDGKPRRRVDKAQRIQSGVSILAKLSAALTERVQPAPLSLCDSNWSASLSRRAIDSRTANNPKLDSAICRVCAARIFPECQKTLPNGEPRIA